MRIALVALAAAILLVATASAVLLATMSSDGGRLVAYLVERTTGRELIVGGRFAIHPSLRPSLVMSQVRIPNPPWASGPDLAQVGHLEVQIALWPLLSGTLVIERLILNDAIFAFERSADGAANWTIGGGGDDLGLVPVFGTVRMRNIAWSYRDDASGHDTSAQLARLTLADAGGAGQLDAEGRWDGQAITAKGTLGTLAEALHPTNPFPLDLALSLPGLDLGVRGTIAEPAAGQGLDLHLVGHSDDIARFMDLLGRDAPLASRLDAAATLGGDFDAVQVSDLRLSVGQPPTFEAHGAIGALRPGGAPLLDGIALQIEGSTATADLATWLGRPLPDLGPIQAQLTLSGSSDALKISGLSLRAGAQDGPTVGASGDVEQIQLAPALSLRGADLQLEAKGPDLAALGTMLDVSLPHGSFSYTGRLSGDPDQWTLAGEARLGDTALTQTFTGSLADAPPGLSGELSVALAGLELTARGTVADPAKRQGLDLHLVGHADDVTALLGLLGHEVPAGGRLAAEATLQGDLAALHLADLRLSLDQATGPASALQATGQIASVRPGNATLLEGIALEVQGTTSTTVLSGWLGRPLPDLGPIQGQFTLSGTSRLVKVADIQMQAGTADRLSVAAKGDIAQIRLKPAPTASGVDLSLDAKASDGAIIGALFDAHVPRLGALAYTGRLSGDTASWALAGKLHVGQTVIDQDLTGSQAGARPRIAGKLSIPTLYLADFGVAADGAGGPDAPESNAPATDWLSSAALRAVDLDLSLDVGQVQGTQLAIGRGELVLLLDDGVLRIDPARFDFVAGTALVHATADTRAKPPQIDLSLHADDVQLGEFLLAIGKTPLMTGELALILKLESRGDAPEQLVSGLDGEVHFALQRGGVNLGNLTLATADVMTWLIAGAQRGTGLLRGITADGQTKLECFVGRLAVAEGIATTQSLLMKTPLTLSTATGTLNLVDETIDLQVRLRARRQSMFDPATTYRIQGPLADPAVSFSKTGFAARAIAGLVMEPLDALGSLLAPLVSDGGRDPSNPCLSKGS